MSQPTSFPAFALGKTKFKSPHKQDLTFAKNEKIRVQSTAPKTEEEQDDDDDDDDDQWYIGESLDGSRKGTFPGNFVEFTDEKPEEEAPGQQMEAAVTEPLAAAPTQVEPEPVSTTSKEAADADVVAKGEPVLDAVPAVQDDAPSQDQPAPAAAGAAAASSGDKLADQPTSPAASTPAPAAPSTNKPAPPPKIGISLKDRIAAFSKPGSSSEGAPPLLPKPAGIGGGWKRPPPPPAGDKPLLPRGQFGARSGGAASGAAGPTLGGRTVPASTAPRSPIEGDAASSQLESTSPGTDAPSAAGGGFSAADAKANIKMSLKERMAALQRGGSDDQASAAGGGEGRAAKSPPPIAPKPGKLSADRRNAALAGMGVGGATAAAGGVAATRQKSADEAGEAVSAGDVAAGEPVAGEGNAAATEADPDTRSEVPAISEEPVQLAGQDETGEAENAQSPTKEEPEAKVAEDAGEPDAEEEEAARRAAIARRLAKLGGQRMGAGPNLFGAPPPIPGSKPKSQSQEIEGTTTEDGIIEADDASAVVASPVSDSAEGQVDADDGAQQDTPKPVAAPQTLAVPRRAAPPRRKKSSAKEVDVPASIVQAPEQQASQEATDAVEAGSAAEAPILQTGDDEAASPVSPAVDVSHAEELGLEPRREVGDEYEDDDDHSMSMTPVSDRNINEHHRALEDFVRGSDPTEPVQEETTHTADQVEQDEAPAVSDDDAALEASEAADEVAPSVPDRRASIAREGSISEAPISPTKPISIGRSASIRSIGSVSDRPPIPGTIPSRPSSIVNPPSRAGSVRPPIPRAMASPPPMDAQAAVGETILRTSTTSPPPPRRSVPTPGPPTSPPPAVPAGAESADDAEEEPQQQPSIEAALGAPILAVPKPRMAVPADDDAFEEGVPGEEAHQDAAAPSIESALPAPSEAPAEPQPAEELTEEEEEAQRRARIAEKMARLGGQRIGGGLPMGIMGAPMPPRRRTTVTEDQGEAQPSVLPTADVEAPSRDIDAVSPPPLPTSPPPPKPTRAVPAGGVAMPSLTSPPPAEDVEVPAALPSSPVQQLEVNSPPLDMDGRRSPTRPPRSPRRRSSAAAPAANDVEHLDLAPVNPAETILSPSLAQAASPPPLAVPPKAPARAAPAAAAAPPPIPKSEVQQEETFPAEPIGQTVSRIRSSSRDLDLMPSSRWWRLGLTPLRLPLTVSGRPDAIMYADTSTATKKGRTKHTAEVHVLFEDYSQTIVDLSFEEDDLDEAQTTLTQRHLFPPAKPTLQQLQAWATQAGAALASAAASLGGGKNVKPVGDGTPRGFLMEVLRSAPKTLPPIGSSFGYPILVQVGPTVTEQAGDEVRPGDFVACYGADLSGRKGIAPYHMQIGSPNDPTIAIAIEYEEKKRKIRCIVQRKTPEELSIRLDDLKSGIIKVGRPIPKEGWIEDWA